MFSLIVALTLGVALALTTARAGIAEDTALDSEEASTKWDYVSASEEIYRGETRDDL